MHQASGVTIKIRLADALDTKQKTMRIGKIPATTAAIAATSIATPDNSSFVFVIFETDSSKLAVKKSDGTWVRSAALA